MNFVVDYIIDEHGDYTLTLGRACYFLLNFVLRYQLDKMYPKWMQFIDDLVLVSASSALTEDNRVSIAKKLIDKYNLLIPP